MQMQAYDQLLPELNVGSAECESESSALACSIFEGSTTQISLELAVVATTPVKVREIRTCGAQMPICIE